MQSLVTRKLLDVPLTLDNICAKRCILSYAAEDFGTLSYFGHPSNDFLSVLNPFKTPFASNRMRSSSSKFCLPSFGV